MTDGNTERCFHAAPGTALWLRRLVLPGAFIPGLVFGCVHAPPVDRPMEDFPGVIACARGECRDTVRITYLGVSGFMIRRGNAILLTGPSYTNPRFHRILVPGLRTLPDSLFIEKMLPRAADSASAILVGHGHYDHLLDVPYIARKRARTAQIYGSPTVYHTLMGDSVLRADQRVDSIAPGEAGNPHRLGRWHYPPRADSAIRVMAIESHHPPNVRTLFGLIRFTYAKGKQRTDRRALPTSASGWKLGETYAYLVDFLAEDRRTPVFRIYFQDTAGSPPHGLLPAFPPADDRPVDAALLCVGNFENARHYPQSLIAAVRPHFVMLGHWEKFFRQQNQPLSLIERTNGSELFKRMSNSPLAGSAWLLPRPGTTVRFCVCR